MLPERCTWHSIARILRAVGLFCFVVAGGLWLMHRFEPRPPAEETCLHSVELIDANGKTVERQSVAGRVTITDDGYDFQQDGHKVSRNCRGLRLIVSRIK